MRLPMIIVTSTLIAGAAASAGAQSLGQIANQTAADRAAHPNAAKTITNSDLPAAPAAAAPSGVPTPADGPIDQVKFEKTYAAGLAAREAMLAIGISSSAVQDRLVTFSAEINLSADRATTAAEKKLAALYLVAEIDCQTVTVAERTTPAAYTDALDKATKSLDLAESVYRSKNQPSPGK